MGESTRGRGGAGQGGDGHTGEGVVRTAREPDFPVDRAVGGGPEQYGPRVECVRPGWGLFRGDGRDWVRSAGQKVRAGVGRPLG